MDVRTYIISKLINGGGGGDINIETLTVTENGTVVAPAGKAYGTVIVNVPARTPRGSGTSAYDVGAFLSDYDWRGAAALQTA